MLEFILRRECLSTSFTQHEDQRSQMIAQPSVITVYPTLFTMGKRGTLSTIKLKYDPSLEMSIPFIIIFSYALGSSVKKTLSCLNDPILYPPAMSDVEFR